MSQKIDNEVLNKTDPKIGIAYAPAHVTGIFEIHNSNPDPLRCGSRGIGFCIDKGVTTLVLSNKGDEQNLRFFFNGQEQDGLTTKTTITNLVGDLPANILVFSYTGLPVSQGFGISGAGALSCAIALNSALNLNLEYNELVNAAHNAEIMNQTGLGDVVAQATGGIVFREREGNLNYGIVNNLDYDPDNSQLIIYILGKGLKTSKIISDHRNIKRINRASKKHLDSIKKSPSIEELIGCSYKFAVEINLMNSNVCEIIKRIHEEQAGVASMIMLGNAVFSMGDFEKIERICSEFGPPIKCKIDPAKANLIKSIN